MAFRTNAGRGSNGHGVALFATTAGTGATQLVLTTAPGTGGASPYTVSPTPVVTAKSGAGVTDTSFVGVVTVTLNVLSGSPVLSGTTTKTAVAGVADFSANGLTVTGAGTWTLTFSSGSLSPAVSATGTTTGPFLQFTTQPGGATSGSAFSPQPVVTAKLAGGSTDTSFVGNVTLAVNTVTGSHSLGGTVTVAAVAGVATFSGVTDTGSGDGTLTATATGYSSATSASFTTAAGGAAAAYVQGIANASQSQSYPLTLVMPGNVTAGNRIIVILKHSYAGTPPSVTDSQGNTYTKHVNGIKDAANGQYLYVFSAPVGSTGACTLTVDSVAHGGQLYVGFAIEASGANGGYDGANDAHSTSSPFSTGSITTTANGDLIISTFAYGSGTISASGGATARLTLGTFCLLETQIQTTAGAIAGAATGTGADFSIGVECSIVAFKAG